MPQNGNVWMQAAAGAAQGAIGMGVQRLGVNYDNRKQLEQQRKLSELQLENESRLMDIQNQKQYEFWLRTGPQAQKEQYKLAGLNPALMYGMGGGGGQTTGAGMPSISTATAENPHTSQSTAAMMGMGLQTALLASQIKNIEADTKLKNADAEKTSGVDTQEAVSRTLLNTQGVENAKAQEALTKAETNIRNIDIAIKESTQQGAINKILYEAKAAEHYMNIARYNDYTASKTMEDNIKKVHAEALNATATVLLIGKQIQNVDADTKLKISQKLKTDQDVKNSIEQIAQGWAQLGLNEKRLQIDALVQKLESMYKGFNLPLGMKVPVHDKEAWIKEFDKILNNK